MQITDMFTATRRVYGDRIVEQFFTLDGLTIMLNPRPLTDWARGRERGELIHLRLSEKAVERMFARGAAPIVKRTRIMCRAYRSSFVTTA